MSTHTLLLGASICAMASSMLATGVSAAEVASVGSTIPDQNAQADAAKRRAAKKAEQEAAKKKKAEAEAAKSKPATPQPSANTDATGKSDADIMVVGVRESLAAAREEKRKSDAIVDVVNAEDIGKLPNNTVGDVIASIPGISVTRSEGEVNDIQLRGLGNVQTTVGGTPIESGADRVATIADLPADLVKSVQVYKTRTPDQVEGSGGGTINIDFRGPTDFKGGFTFVTSAQGRFINESRKWNHSYTGVANYRSDTSIGTLGAQFGVTVNYNPFLESQAYNTGLRVIEDRQVVGPNLLPLPLYSPSQAAFRYVEGSRTTPSYNASLQWANDNGNEVTVDGFYATPTFDYTRNELYADISRQANSTNTLPALSNIVLVPGTNRLASVTSSQVTQIGPISYIETRDTSNFLGRLKASHDEERFRVYAEIAYTGSNVEFQRYETYNRFVNRPTFDVEFASDKFRFPQMNLDFRNLDLLDPDQYRFNQFVDRREVYSNRTLSSQVDFTLRMYETMFAPFLRDIKFGVRFSHRTSDRSVQSRTISNLQIARGDLPPGFQTLLPISKGFQGTGVENNARWLTYDEDSFRNNYDALRVYISQLPGGSAFASKYPNGDNSTVAQFGERNFSAYGMARYNLRMIFPIEGIFGLRVTSTELKNDGVQQRTTRTTTGTVTEITPVSRTGRVFFVEPTATAKIRFTPNLNLRLSYNVGVRRPDVTQLTPYAVLTETTSPPTAVAGNPDLKPEKTIKYDASLEWYFGRNRTGLIAINPFYWKLDGAISRFTTLELLNPDSDVLYRTDRPFNAGRGHRRGVELQGQTFFTFLPGVLKNFGVQANYTFVDSKLRYDRVPGSSTTAPLTVPILNTPRNVFNVTGLFERGGLNARVNYNWNGRMISANRTPAVLSEYFIPRDWMDAAVNYTFRGGALRNLSLSLQVQNVLASARRDFYGYPDQPRTVTYMARTYGGRIGYKF